MPRFVILTHDHPSLHWDLLLEDGNSCRTWRLLTDPGSSSKEFPAEQLLDHRLMYLDYEGPVSGNRGTVARWDVGTFEWRVNTQNFCEVNLDGEKWSGIVQLRQLDGKLWQAARSVRNKP